MTSELAEAAKQLSGYDNSFQQLQRITFPKGCSSRVTGHSSSPICDFMLWRTRSEQSPSLALTVVSRKLHHVCAEFTLGKEDEKVSMFNFLLSTTSFSNYTFCCCASLWYQNRNINRSSKSVKKNKEKLKQVNAKM